MDTSDIKMAEPTSTTAPASTTASAPPPATVTATAATTTPAPAPATAPDAQHAKPPTPPTSEAGGEKESKLPATIDTDPKASASTPTPTPTSTSADAKDGPETPPFSPSSTTAVLPKEDPELDFTGNIDVNDDIPTDNDLARVEDLLILDSKGQSRPFKELYKGEGVAKRQLIIFVRHFFCGNCQEYLRELSASITPESLLALPEPTFITIIGCGRPDLIEMYTQTTNCPFPIYADPTRKLYDLLGMTRTFDLGKKPSYIQSNLLVTSVQSIVQSLKTGNKALKGGDFKQVGGEFLFEDKKCVFAHRMRNTRDHMEIKDLRGLLGLGEIQPPLRKRWSHSVKGVKEKEVKTRTASWGRVRSKSKGTKEKEGSKTPEPVEENTEKTAATATATAPTAPAPTESAPTAAAPTTAAQTAPTA